MEEELGQCSKEEGVTMADRVDMLGVDLRTRVKRLGAKGKARWKKCKTLDHEEEQDPPKELQEGGGQEGATSGYGASKNVVVHAVGMAPTERSKLRRQMAAAARKTGTTSLSLFMDAFGLEVEEDLSTLATRYWAEGAWIGKWPVEQKEAWMNQAPEVQTWRQVRGPAGAVTCETCDLVIKWPHWHTLIFEDEVRIDMRYICPKDVKKMFV